MRYFWIQNLQIYAFLIFSFENVRKFLNDESFKASFLQFLGQRSKRFADTS